MGTSVAAGMSSLDLRCLTSVAKLKASVAVCGFPASAGLLVKDVS